LCPGVRRRSGGRSPVVHPTFNASRDRRNGTLAWCASTIGASRRAFGAQG
jgi:hypothetical protein